VYVSQPRKENESEKKKLSGHLTKPLHSALVKERREEEASGSNSSNGLGCHNFIMIMMMMIQL
jgi:hypothetical protein